MNLSRSRFVIGCIAVIIHNQRLRRESATAIPTSRNHTTQQSFGLRGAAERYYILSKSNIADHPAGDARHAAGVVYITNLRC
jgi:hypothetical protein